MVDATELKICYLPFSCIKSKNVNIQTYNFYLQFCMVSQIMGRTY
jgi:hypothetical protein